MSEAADYDKEWEESELLRGIAEVNALAARRNWLAQLAATDPARALRESLDDDQDVRDEAMDWLLTTERGPSRLLRRAGLPLVYWRYIHHFAICSKPEDDIRRWHDLLDLHVDSDGLCAECSQPYPCRTLHVMAQTVAGGGDT